MNSEKVIKALRDAQERELLATVVYSDQHYCLENLGLDALAKELEAIAIEEMKHHEALAERVLFLGGSPSRAMTKGAKFEEKDPAKMLKIDIALEEEAVELYNQNIQLCAAEGDEGTRLLFAKLLVEEEHHLDVFRKKLELLEKYGDLYLLTKCM